MNIFDFLIHFNVLVFSLFSALLPGYSNYYELIYGAPWCRFVPYGVGMILGCDDSHSFVFFGCHGSVYAMIRVFWSRDFFHIQFLFGEIGSLVDLSLTVFLAENPFGFLMD